jgi:hypothetical protein
MYATHQKSEMEKRSLPACLPPWKMRISGHPIVYYYIRFRYDANIIRSATATALPAGRRRRSMERVGAPSTRTTYEDNVNPIKLYSS